MRILIYGGRDFKGDDVASQWLGEVLSPYFPLDPTIVSGGARGADVFGEDWAFSLCLRTEVFRADWNAHGKAAGAIRNQRMLDSGIDLAVQFPGGRGTADMRRRLDIAGVKVIEYHDS